MKEKKVCFFFRFDFFYLEKRRLSIYLPLMT